jgi:hypothetical protein
VTSSFLWRKRQRNLAALLFCAGLVCTEYSLASMACSEVFQNSAPLEQLFEPSFWERLNSKDKRVFQSLATSSAANTSEHLRSRVDFVLTEVLKRSNYRVFPVHHVQVTAKARRNPVIEAIYSRGLVEHSALTLLLSDKLIMAKALEYFLGHEFNRFHPKTMGLVEFLVEKEFLNDNGELIANREVLKEALDSTFPKGFIVKKATGWNSKGREIYSKPSDVISDIFSGESSALFQSEHFRSPLRSESLGVILSGERWIVQEKIGESEALVYLKSPGVGLKEYRVHTIWGSVIKGATLGRWPDQDKFVDEKDFTGIDLFAQEFLNRLPLGLRQQQGWSFDIVESRPGDFQIVEVNTNRGMSAHWSGWFQSPMVLGALVRHLELQFKWRFMGINGFILRQNYGNYFRYKEDTRRHVDHNLEQDRLKLENELKKIQTLEKDVSGE